MTEQPFTTEQITLTCADGQRLAATLYHPQQSNGLSLQINAATGVPRGYYNAFAGFQAAKGFTVLTFDYRGICDSRHTPGAPAPRMLDWGRQDVNAAASYLTEHFPALTPTMVCHSFGGQVLGLMPRADRIAAVVCIAAQHGYWRNWSRGHQWKLLLSWYVAFPLVVGVLGHLPGWWLGGQTLPGGVARDWRRWCCSPHYLIDDAGHPLRPHNDLVRAPIRLMSFDDDLDFGPRKGVDRLASYYPHARIERRHVMPAEWGVARIGHFGFFRRDMPQECWNDAGDWLVQRAAERRSRAA